MIMLPDHYMQGSRKNYETELKFKQNTSKPLFSDPEEIWELENVCEDLITSGNDSDPEENLCDDFTELPDEILEGKRQFNPTQKKNFKNVRFESSNFNYVLESSDTSSVGNKYIDIDCRYAERRRSLTQEPETLKVKDNLRGNFKQKWRPMDCYDKKYERRPKSSPEKSSSYLERSSLGLGDYSEVLEQRHKTRKKWHKCGKCCGDVDIESEITRKFTPKCKHDFGDNCARQKHSQCCDHYSKEEGRKKNYNKARPVHKLPHGTHVKEQVADVPKICKKAYRENRQPQDVHFESFAYNSYIDRYSQFDDFYGSTKTKKKILEAVQEQQEQLSDSTYKLPCAKLSSHTIPGEANGLVRTKSSEKLTNSSQSEWKYCNGKNFEEKLYQPQRIHKLRSRRTRMNRLKNGWKKAFVQTVRDGTRNERVGVLVMGPKGPEFFSKNQLKPSGVPFRKSKSFLEGEAKSFDAANYVSQNVFPSSSEPGPQINYAITEFACPEEDLKVEEKIANFNKNFNDILKTSEEKFYKALSNNDFSENRKKQSENIYIGAGEGGKKELQKNEKSTAEIKSKYSPFPLLPLEELSPRIPRVYKKPELKINEESKAKADALNEKAKQYKESQINLKIKEDDFLQELKELQEKIPPKEMSSETADGNISLWGMKLDQLSEETECSEDKKEQRNEDSLKQEGESNVTPKANNKEKTGKDEMSQIGSVKSSDQTSTKKQISKKYFEAAAIELNNAEDKSGGNGSTANTQIKSDLLKTPRNWMDDNGEKRELKEVVQETERDFISAVFRDLVENGCAISQEESENLQNVFNKVTYNDDTASEFSSGVINITQENKISESSHIEDSKHNSENLRKENKCFGSAVNEEKKNYREKSESYREGNNNRKTSKIKNFSDDKKGGSRTKSKKKILPEDKMRLLRQALPGIAAEKEATHLKQLKKYIDRFIERVEASTSSECRRKKDFQLKETCSTDSGEVKVDAKKILDIVSNPFERISSDVTINIAKKLTDALVQDKARTPKYRSPKCRNNYENAIYEEEPPNIDTTSGSDRQEETEPTYLKQLKKMRNEHLNNIVMEVKRLSELLRFLDRCNRLTS